LWLPMDGLLLALMDVPLWTREVILILAVLTSVLGGVGLWWLGECGGAMGLGCGCGVVFPCDWGVVLMGVDGAWLGLFVFYIRPQPRRGIAVGPALLHTAALLCGV
ncbi:hypothetical protein RA264_28025, partial [Pseudomonas syringae pv. tagetis]